MTNSNLALSESAGTRGRGISVGRYSVAALVGLAPVATMLVSSLDPADPIQPWERVVKAFALPVAAVEILVILIAFFGSGRWAPTGLGRSRTSAALALLALMIATAAFAAVSPGTAFVRTGLLLIHVAFAWSVFRLGRQGALEAGSMTDGLLAGFLLSGALLILFIGRIEDPSTFAWAHDLPGLDNIRRGAYFAAPIAGLCIGRFAVGRGEALALPVLALTLAIAFIAWSGARGGAAAIAAAVLAGTLLVPALRSLKVMLLTLGASTAGILLAWLYSLQTCYKGFWRMLPGSGSAATGEAYDATSGRTELWAGTWQAILERPLFGHGEGQTAFAVPIGQQTAAFHPHNLVLQILLAWGLVGALLLLYLAIPFARTALATARRQGECIAPFMAMLVLLLYSAVDGTLFHVHATGIFAACAGLVAAYGAPSARDSARA